MANKNKVFGDITLQDIAGSYIRWKNFRGEKKISGGRVVNDEGNRNFAIFFEDLDFAQKLSNDGWPIRFRDPREEGDDPQAILKVKVRYDKVPPRVMIVKGDGKFQELSEDMVGILDSMRIDSASVVLHPYNYASSDNSGEWDVSVYCKALYVVPGNDPIYDIERHYGATDDYDSDSEAPDDGEVPFD